MWQLGLRPDTAPTQVQFLTTNNTVTTEDIFKIFSDPTHIYAPVGATRPPAFGFGATLGWLFGKNNGPETTPVTPVTPPVVAGTPTP